MKARVVFSVLLVLLVAVFYFSKPNARENSVTNVSTTGVDSFGIGAYWDGYVRSNYDSLKELGFNRWQFPGGIYNGWIDVGVDSDYREAPYNNYGSNVINKINSNFSNGNLKTIMDRPKINYLGYGKRSDYECEENNINSNYWFYAYREHDPNVSRDTLDNSQYESSNTNARYSKVSNGNTAGYVVQGLIANREQLNFPYGLDFKWYIMPRIRIDSAFANDPNNFDVPVCYIELKNYYGNPILGKERITLHVRNFKNNSYTTVYNGRYREQFDFSNLYSDTTLTIDSTGLFNPYPHHDKNNDECRVDIRVYWCGQCDMWLDRVRVENQIAYDLLDDNPCKIHYYVYQKWLDYEIPMMAKQGNTYIIYKNGYELCNLPVLERLNYEIYRRVGNNIALFSKDKPVFPNFIIDKYYVSNLRNYYNRQ